MALILPNSIFLHIPKTGGSWVRKALEAGGLQGEERDWAHSRVTKEDSGGLFRFAFVRHPLEWYRSRWMYRMERGWRDHHIDDKCISCEFAPFVEKMIVYKPGYLSSIYRLYCGPVDEQIEFIGRQENLVEDLITALKTAGETFDEGAIRSKSKVNICGYRYPAEYSPELERALATIEADSIRRFYGHDKPTTA